MWKRLIIFALGLAIASIFVVRTWLFHHAGASPAIAERGHTIDEVYFHGATVDAAVAELSRQSGVKIGVDWAELEKSGISRQQTVTMHFFDLPVKRVLQEICSQAGGSGPPLITVDNQDGLKITSESAIKLRAELRMYDVSDLVDQSPWFDDFQPQEKIDAVVRLLEEAVDANSWQDNGGLPGQTESSHGRLFIVQSPENHRMIETVLLELRRMQSDARMMKPVEKPRILLTR